MAIYTYQVIHDDGTEGEVFEVMRGMNEAPLTHHPETGERVVRVFTAPHTAGWANERMTKQMLGDKNLEQKGFTKYVRSGKGHYERHAGKEGPSSLSVD